MRFPHGDANIHVDGTDPSFLHLNYWPLDVRDGQMPRYGDEYAQCVEHDCVIQLRNRTSRRYPFTATNFAGVVLPLRVRMGGDRNGVDIDTDADAGINGNLMVSRRWGSQKYFYERSVSRAPYVRYELGVGVLAGLSAETVSASNSRGAAVPRTTDVGMAVGTVGFGVIGGARGFTTGLFVGLDYGLTDGAEQWDYNGRPWVGVMLGLKPFGLNL